MKLVFADTLYWIALDLERDSWHNETVELTQRMEEVTLVTTDEVLTEYMTALADRGEYFRARAVSTVEILLKANDIIVLPQSRNSFLEGLDLYRRRLDKEYSLTDCISMSTCKRLGIVSVLTNDHHFSQEGLQVLITR